jgi:hypothetical protein
MELSDTEFSASARFADRGKKLAGAEAIHMNSCSCLGNHLKHLANTVEFPRCV